MKRRVHEAPGTSSVLLAVEGGIYSCVQNQDNQLRAIATSFIFKFAVCAVAGGAICITQNSLEVGNSDIIVPPHWAVGGVLLVSHEDCRCHSD